METVSLHNIKLAGEIQSDRYGMETVLVNAIKNFLCDSIGPIRNGNQNRRFLIVPIAIQSDRYGMETLCCVPSHETL